VYFIDIKYEVLTHAAYLQWKLCWRQWLIGKQIVMVGFLKLPIIVSSYIPVYFTQLSLR